MIKEHINLKPCPLCGADPEYSEHVISCSNCLNVLSFGTTFEDVSEKWNDRQTASVELIRRIDSIIKKLEEWASYHYNQSEIVSDNHAAASCGFTQAIELLEESLKP